MTEERADSALPNIEMQPTASLDGSHYQAYPTMDERELGALMMSVNSEGFRPTTPIVTDEQGRVLCGHMRLMAARQLSLPEVPTIILCDLSEEAKWQESLRDNAARRQRLSPEQRKDIARRLLEHFHYWSDRAIAADAGLSQTTVGKLRKEVSTQVSTVDTSDRPRIGRDGKVYPASQPSRRPSGEPVEVLRVWVREQLPQASQDDYTAIVMEYAAAYPDSPPEADLFNLCCRLFRLGQQSRGGRRR